MSTLVGHLFDSFTDVISGLAGGLKNAFGQLIYVDPDATTPVLSPLVQFVFITAGIAIAMGVLYKIFGLIKNRGVR